MRTNLNPIAGAVALRSSRAIITMLVVPLVLCSSAFSQTTQPVGEWVSNPLKIGAATIVPVPGSDDLLAGTMRGENPSTPGNVFRSTDGGASWTKLGGGEGSEPMNTLCTGITIDPKDPNTFWVTGAYGWQKGEPCLFKTTDGGKTFHLLGAITHSDDISIDFTDPQRLTMLQNIHESPGGIYRSTDGGKKWFNFAKKTYPAGYGIILKPIMFDAKTYVLGTDPGWIRGPHGGIVRTDDGGATWEKSSDLTPKGDPLVTSDGKIFWSTDKSLIVSADKGKTWTTAGNGSSPVEIGPGKVAGMSGKQVMLTTDSGKTWEKLGPAAPAAGKLLYTEKSRRLYVWGREGGKSISYLALPADKK